MHDLTIYDDYDTIISGSLYQGSFPPSGSTLANEHGFDVLVLCAYENPDVGQYEGVEVIEALGADVSGWPVDPGSVERWCQAARDVSARVKEGRRVLVTCMAGLNRSGFVSAMVLHEVYGWSGDRCVRHVQNAREDALFRREFCRYLRAFVREKP